MSITFEEAETQLKAFADRLIQQLRSSAARLIDQPALQIELQPGEWYAGAVLNEDGSVKHHLIVADSDNAGRTFAQVQAWAAARELSALTRQESRLIVAHRYSRLPGMSWFWTSEEHEDASYAWGCNLGYGLVLDGSRSAEGGAVAVRRVNP